MPTADNRLEELLLHAFLDVINERKARGKLELVVTYENLTAYLAERTGLPLQTRHVQALVRAMAEGGLITIGGAGPGHPNRYDTTEAQMGIDAFWNQVEAFLMVWRLPGRESLLSPGSERK
ncbi:MAG: hypothetical protein L6E13_10795 [Firmicutes bacterium]|nr:hypothetical protein [Bacillota bacterium]